jgi:hypothetical protein
MEDFWQVVKTWPAIGQGIFLLILFGSFVTLIGTLAYYITIIFRGWPPEHLHESGWVHQITNELNEDDGDDD